MTRSRSRWKHVRTGSSSSSRRRPWDSELSMANGLSVCLSRASIASRTLWAIVFMTVDRADTEPGPIGLHRAVRERPIIIGGEPWSGVRVVEGARLEIVYRETYRGFESHPLRQRIEPETKTAPRGISRGRSLLKRSVSLAPL